MAQDPLNAIAASSQQEPAQASAQVSPEISPEDQARAGLYGLLAALLRDVPGETLLARTRALDPARERDGFALAWEGLRLAAAQVTAAEADDEYHRLFIGLGRGELVPYGSWYLTGLLRELPLG
jgi:TorA maturation chaperone TorD